MELPQQDASAPSKPSNNQKRLYTDNFFSQFFFHYASKVISVGNRKTFEERDLYRLDDELLFANHFKAFERYWQANPTFSYKKAFSLWLLKHNYLMVVGQLVLNLMSVINPFFIKFLINWFLNPNDAVYKGYIYSMVLFLVSFSRPFLNQHSIKYGYASIIYVNAMIFGTYFKKFQSISMSASRYINIGNITTSITADSIKIIIFIMTFANLFVGPALTIAFLILIIIEIGWVGIIGMLVIFVFIFLQMVVGRRMEAIAKEKSFYLDQRNRQVTNALTGIKTIKFSNWESIVLGIIDKLRRAETHLSMKSTFVRGLLESFSFVMPLLASFVSIWIYQARNGLLSLGSIFYIISVFNMMTAPMRIFFFAAITYIEAKVGLERIGRFCSFPDQDPKDDVLRDDATLPMGQISVRNATISFDNEELRKRVQNTVVQKEMRRPSQTEKAKAGEKPEKIKPVLKKGAAMPSAAQDTAGKSTIFKNLSLEVQPGQFVAVIGKVGSGKTAFLKALLGALFFEEGEVRKNGRIAYIPQESFLINGTLRDNVLFGSPYDEDKYKKAIRICELEPDLQILPGGDMTEIGERGINLSGGQKQRIAIARAFYAGADIFLIDDSLSAVDAHVGQNLFRNVFKRSMAGKTIILVTHALQYLSDVDRIIMFDNGQVIGDGKYAQLRIDNPKFNEFVKEVEQEHKKSSVKITLEESRTESVARPKEKELVVEKKEEPVKPEAMVVRTGEATTDLQKKGRLSKAELRFKGQVGLKLYYEFFKKGNFFFFLVCLAFFAVSIAGRILADWWVGSWSTNAFPNLTFNQSLLIYFGIAIVTFCILVTRSILWAAYTARIAFRLFKTLIERIMNKQMSFFDTTPLGQILNLTSKDTDLADLNIPPTFLNFLSNILQVIGIFILVSISNVILIPVIIFITILNLIVIARYLRVSMELRRLEQLAYSPILSNIIELFNGLPIFRAFDKTSFQETVYTENVNRLLAITWHDRVVTLYTNFLTEIMMALLIGITFFLLCIGKQYELSFVVGNPSFVALTISWILSIPLIIQFMMFMFAETAKGMSSVQRIMYNIDKKDMERLRGVDTPPEDWPTRGEIRAVNVSARYRPQLPLVIKNVTFSIRPHEKIGIVGRTGSGKSTTILLLTRLLEIDNEEESFIQIDGYKIHKLDLQRLRSSLKIIPQDPYILKGTLRSNIDPFNKFSDERIIEALKKALLWDSDFFENKLGIKKRDNHILAKIRSKISRRSSQAEIPGNRSGGVNTPARHIAPESKGTKDRIVIVDGELRFQEGADDNAVNDNDLLGGKRPESGRNEQQKLLAGDNTGRLAFPQIQGGLGSKLVSGASHNKQNFELGSKGGLGSINSKNSEMRLEMQEEAEENQLKLGFEIEDAGKNLSVGEKQLVCIARALLDVPKILLMDEATSNIDQFTDLQIQEVIKTEFTNTTIITIAHRLNTIIQYDRIFVMEQGQLIEQGTPLELLSQDSTFRSMVRENGPDYEKKLFKLAENKDLSLLDEFSENPLEINN